MKTTKTTGNPAEPPARPTPPAGGMTPMLFEHGGWAIYTSSGDTDRPQRREGDCLTHTGCDSFYPNWASSIYIWSLEGDSPNPPLCFTCKECKAVMSKESWLAFARTYKLLNKSL